MTIKKIIELLSCHFVSDFIDLSRNIEFAYASDLMSDILVKPRPGALLVTGLINYQVVRTSKIAGIYPIIFARNKKPEEGVFKLSNKYKIPILLTKFSMFETCGILFSNGIRAVKNNK